MFRSLRLLLTLTLLTGVAAGAQGPPPGGPPPGGPPMAGPPPEGDPAQRAQLEARIRQRLGEMMRTQLDLTDEQFTKLQATNRKYDERRRLLVGQERDIRMAMRDELLAGDSAQQGKVNDLLDRMLKVQQQRLSINEAEQRELATFLSPAQRAKYLGIEEAMRRRMQQMRENLEQRQGRPPVAAERLQQRRNPARPARPGGTPPLR